jgi:hypothetical protein
MWGAALSVPAAFAWTTRLVEKGADGFTAKVEGASKTVGTVTGARLEVRPSLSSTA